MDSRSSLRYSVELSGTLLLGSTVVSCQVQNLSLGGVFVRGPTLPTGSHVTLRFSAPNMPAFETTCTVRWSTDDGTGLAFDGLQTVDTYTLAKLLRGTKRPSQPLQAPLVVDGE